MQEMPPDLFDLDAQTGVHEEAENPDVRVPEKDRDKVVLSGKEFFEDDMDVDGHTGPKGAGGKGAARP